jgi:hypothetical protein
VDGELAVDGGVNVAPIMPFVMGATAIMNILNRNTAAAGLQTAEEAGLPTPEQTMGSTIQGYADRGLNIGADSPAVLEALRRRQVPLQQQKARLSYQNAFSGGDPLSALFGLLSGGTNTGTSGTSQIPPANTGFYP